MTKQTGGPAFPLPFKWDEPENNGMTLRDYFAAKAMQGMFANPELVRNGINFAMAYAAADTMLKAREK